jgi:hypothetical protein
MDQTRFYWWLDEKELKTLVVCGCFSGTLEQFKKQVKEAYGCEKHGKEYMKQIKLVEYLIREE